MSHDELLTVIVEVEAVLNSWPLSYLDPDDLEETLTPSHLIVGRRLMDFPDHSYPEPEGFEAEADSLTRQHRHINRIIQHFWSRWRREYLLESH